MPTPGTLSRRWIWMALVGVAVVAVVVGTWVVVERRDGDDGVADRLAYRQQGAFVVGREVHVGNHVVALKGTLTEIAYTSAGVLVYDSGIRLGGEEVDYVPSSVTLVTPDGKARPIRNRGLVDRSGLPSTDPGLPYVAFLRETGRPGSGRYEIVLLDLRSGKERVLADPVADPVDNPDLDGLDDLALGKDLVLEPQRRSTNQLDWRTGEVVAPYHRHGISKPSGYGRSAYVATLLDRKVFQIRDRVDDAVLRSVPFPDGRRPVRYPSLSVDDRWFAVPTGDRVVVHEVATGDRTVLTGVRPERLGWTPDGHLLGRSTGPGSVVTTCDPRTGTCRRSDVRWSAQRPPVLATGSFGEIWP